MITNLGYADDIILLATSEAELQELVHNYKKVPASIGLVKKYHSIHADGGMVQQRTRDRKSAQPIRDEK